MPDANGPEPSTRPRDPDISPTATLSNPVVLVTNPHRDSSASVPASAPASGPALAIGRPVSSSESKPRANERYADGAARAWSTVAGAALMQMVTIGFTTTFGVTQSYYLEIYLPQSTSSAISWIGSIALFLGVGVPIIIGILVRVVPLRVLMAVGSVIHIFSLFMLSLAKPGKYYQILLSQGIGLGLGTGIVYLLCFIAVSDHFKTRKAMAMGLVAACNPLGALVWSIALNQLLSSSIGFGWSIRIIAFIVLGVAIFANLLLFDVPAPPSVPASQPQPQTAASSSEKPSERPRSPFRDPVFVLVLLSGFWVSLGIWFPAFYVQLFAQVNGAAHIPKDLAFYSIAILYAGNVLGRILPNMLADRVSGLKVYGPCILAAGALSFGLFACKTKAGLICFCIFYGFFFGSSISLYLPIITAVSPPGVDVNNRMGISLFPVSIATLIGTPISGAIVGNDLSNLHWWGGVGFAAATILISSALIFSASWIYTRRLATEV